MKRRYKVESAAERERGRRKERCKEIGGEGEKEIGRGDR